MPRQNKAKAEGAKNRIVLVVGRWQPFHLGHLDLLRRSIKKYGDIVIGIGSSNKSHTRENPFTLEERVSMISACLHAEKLSGRVVIVPIPDIGNDSKWLKMVERMIPEIGIVITGNDWCRRIFSEAGYTVLPPRFCRKEFYNGTHIREDICSQKKIWKKKVHPAVYEIIEGIAGLDDRFKRTKDKHHGKCWKWKKSVQQHHHRQ